MHSSLSVTVHIIGWLCYLYWRKSWEIQRLSIRYGTIAFDPNTVTQFSITGPLLSVYVDDMESECENEHTADDSRELCEIRSSNCCRHITAILCRHMKDLGRLMETMYEGVRRCV